MQENLNERPSSPTHAGEPNNINNTTDTTEPNVLGAAPCSPLMDRLYASFLSENPQYTIDDVEMYDCVNGHAVPKKGVRLFR